MLEKGMSIKFPNGKNDLMNFQIEIKPSENYWQGGRFTFTFKIPDSYPHEPPKVLCDQIVYHPNLDTKGNICLNVLREDWSPVQTVTSVIFGLLFLFIDPNASDPLNSEAAKDLMQSTSNFKSNVRKAMMGGIINGVRFTKVI
jgi:ubiquitin-conjugating enzyme E2 M